MLIDIYPGGRIKTCDHCRTNWTPLSPGSDILVPPGGLASIKSTETMCSECIERRVKFIRRFTRPSSWSSFGIEEGSSVRADSKDSKS